MAGNGTNCERETAFACRMAGFDSVHIAPIWDVMAGDVRFGDFQLLCLPGGFMDGDDLGAARAGANRVRHARIAQGEIRLWDELRAFVDAGHLILGICNGFQLLVKLGLLPGLDGQQTQRVSLTHNASGRFENRWVHLSVDAKSPCIFTRGLKRLELPVRHGEGKLMVPDAELGQALEDKHLLTLRYAGVEDGLPTEVYPANPNGSPGGVAALCDPSGRIFGLMPHPEAFVHRTHHPRWTRRSDLPEEGAGLAMFRKARDFLQGD